jgi:hypothetical protein
LAVWRLFAVYLVILAGVVAVSAQRLTALTLPAVPRALWGPFVRPLASAAFEMALLLAVPAAVLAARAAGLRLRATVLAAAALIAFNVATALGLDPGSVAPGRIAQQLIDSGRDSCPSSPGHRVVVPLVGLTWTCPPGEPARLSGHTPVGRPKVDYSATALTVSEDLRQIEVTGLALEVPASRERFGLRATVGRARLRGLPPWGRPAGRSTVSRLLSSVLACVATLAMALRVLFRLPLGSLLAALLGAAGGLCPLLANRALDRFGTASYSYWLVIVAGPLGVLLTALVIAGAQRAFRGRSSVARGAG